MPHAFLLHLSGATSHPPRYPGLYAHGLFFALLGKLDPTLANQIHAAPRKPFTVASLECKEGVVLRVTTLDDALFASLLKTLLQESVHGLPLGEQSFSLSKVIATPQGDPLAGYKSWQELAGLGATRQLRLHFKSPTVFTTSKADKRTRHTPLPDPFLIAKSLLSSWQFHSPQRFSEVDAAALQMVFELDLELTRFANLRFEKAQAAKGFFPAFTGQIELFCHSDSLQVQQALATLQAYAFFAGVGAKTTYGLGLTTPL
jgi:CRISPR-associated endoribonuclease Cas6